MTWTIRGQATIGSNRPAWCELTIRPDGTWSAEIATFTIAAGLDLLLVSDQGGHFCGPVAVAHSRADTAPLRASTKLEGCGPLLIVAPERAAIEQDEVLEGEVVQMAIGAPR